MVSILKVLLSSKIQIPRATLHTVGTSTFKRFLKMIHQQRERAQNDGAVCIWPSLFLTQQGLPETLRVAWYYPPPPCGQELESHYFHRPRLKLSSPHCWAKQYWQVSTHHCESSVLPCLQKRYLCKDSSRNNLNEHLVISEKM